MSEETQKNYTIGEEFELPSKGLIYGKKMSPTIELRSMTARDEMRRMSPSLSKFKNMCDLIETCCIEKPAVHVYDMAIGDYEFLLHRLRVVTYGDDYKMSLLCPHCGKPFDTIAHLDDLDVKDFNIDEFNAARSITLPRTNAQVTLNFQTPRMLDEIDAKIKDLTHRFPSAETAFDLLVTLEAVIDTVNGEKLDQAKMETFINKLPAMDMQKILNSVFKLNDMVGIDNKLIVTCDKCGGEVSTSFRFGSEFFGPTTI